MSYVRVPGSHNEAIRGGELIAGLVAQCQRRQAVPWRRHMGLLGVSGGAMRCCMWAEQRAAIQEAKAGTCGRSTVLLYSALSPKCM